jgi:hypothetical protein
LRFKEEAPAAGVAVAAGSLEAGEGLMIENRKSVRHRVFKAGIIEFNRAGGISCTVRNISDGGACLEVASPLGIPDDFDLHIASDRRTIPCHRVWINDRRVGVSFRAPIAA